MRLSLVFGVIGHLLVLFSMAFLPPLILAFAQGEYAVAGHFAVALAASLACGWGMGRGFPREPILRRSEAFAIVAGTWLVVAHFGAIPYVFAGLSPVDAVFESMSGFTTTGATIVTDFTAHGDAFYLWRAMSQWIGGLGVIALFVVVLPRLGIGGRQVFFAESSISTSEGISPQIRGAARKLWGLYAGLSALLVILLMTSGLGLYDAVVHAMTTMSAGGFSPHGRSIEHFGNPSAEWIFVVFMVISGTSFPLLWRLVTGRLGEFFGDLEWLVYVGGMLVASVGLAALLTGGLPDLDGLRKGAFQVASMSSSTGYASADFGQWAWGPKAVLVLVMLFGGCAGSASGGPKVIRWVLTFKFLRREVTQTLHPQAVLPLEYRGRPIESPILRAILSLVVLYLLGYVLLALALMIAEPNLDLGSAFSASISCLGNIGPGFASAGPMGGYAGFSSMDKVLLTGGMWLGRLEIITVLALLHGHAWRHTTLRAPREG